MMPEPPARPGPNALDSVRVVDFTAWVAGPYCTKLLAAHGAEVIKIERPSGDPARSLPPFAGDEPGLERSGLFAFLNTGKQSLVLDLDTEDGRRAARDLVRTADVVVESFAPGTMERWGLGFADLAAIRPGLVMTSVSNFGQTGPMRDEAATEITLLAASGWMSTVGDPDREPLKLGGRQAQLIAGLSAACATLTALVGARASGVAQHVDLSIQEAVIDLLVEPAAVAAYWGSIFPRVGSNHHMTHPAGTLPCKDGYVTATGGEMGVLAEIVGEPRLAEPRFADSHLRRENAAEFDALLTPWLLEHEALEIQDLLQALRMQYGKVTSAEDLLHDEHLVQRGFFVDVDHPVLGKLRLPGPPPRMSATPPRTERPPLLGEHAGRLSSWLKRAPSLAASDPSAPGTPTTLLQGIRVLDLTAIWAGPHAACLLADYGADVVKIEAVQRLDRVRIGIPQPDREMTANPWERGWTFNRLNRNKRSLTLNLASDQGKELFLRLLPHFDVVLDNYSARVMGNFGLDYEALRRVKPDVIQCSMPGFGLSGPYRDYVSLGSTIIPMAGLSWLTGYEDGPPMYCGLPYGDPLSALTATTAILAALVHRRQSGEGQFIEVSQLESSVVMGPEALADYVLNGRVQTRVGNRGDVLQGAVRVADGKDAGRIPPPSLSHIANYRPGGVDRWVAFSVCTDESWRALCAAIGRPELGSDPRFESNARRLANHDAALGVVQDWARSRDEREVEAGLRGCGVPAGVVKTNLDTFHDPHLRERGFWVSIDKEGIGPLEYSGGPWKPAGEQRVRNNPPPEFGRHNAEILREFLNLSGDELAALERDEIIGAVPKGI